jgi:hypothetical protein
MEKYNIFQGNTAISEVIYEVLGYEKNKYMSSSVTKDIYFQSYFYLCNRFGEPEVFDDYKKIMVWRFKVKQYMIEINLNSSWVNFIIYGAGSNKKVLSKNNFRDYSMKSSFFVRYWREEQKNKNKFLNFYSEKKTIREVKIINKLWNNFSKLNSFDSDEWTSERIAEEKQSEWNEYLENYNKSIINTDVFKELSKESYYNSNTKHALKTLRQFLNNMLTSISIRDCSFNIKGRCGCENEKYTNNIKIEYITKLKKK